MTTTDKKFELALTGQVMIIFTAVTATLFFSLLAVHQNHIDHTASAIVQTH